MATSVVVNPVALEVSKIVAQDKRLGGSFFFCRGGGDRSSVTRFAATLVGQMTVTNPEAAPFIHAAMKAASGSLAASPSYMFNARFYRPFYEPR
jgi:hypothetical protein